MSEPFRHNTLVFVVLGSEIRPFFITTVFLSDSHGTQHGRPSKSKEGVTILVVKFPDIRSKAFEVQDFAIERLQQYNSAGGETVRKRVVCVEIERTACTMKGYSSNSRGAPSR